ARRGVAARVGSMGRYRGAPPGADAPVTLVEGATPLLEVAPNVLVKDEARNPTGSFKARGMSAAVTMARKLGAKALVAPSAGNAAGALAAYGARAGPPGVVAMPQDTPRPLVEEGPRHRRQVHLRPRAILDAARRPR